MLHNQIAEKSGKAPWLALFVSVLPTAALMSIDKQAMAVLAPMIRHEFGFDVVTMTKILAASAWAYSFAQLPGAWLAGKIGPYKMLALCCLAWSISVILTPLATTVWMFFAFRFLMGVGQSPDWTATMMIIRRAFPAKQRSRASSYGLATLYISTFLSAPITIFIAERSDWQTCFYIFGAVGILLGVLMLTVLKPPPDSLEAIEEAADHTRRIGLKKMLKSSQVHAVASTYFFLVGIQSFFFTIIPLYLIGKRDMSLSSMGWYSSAPFLTLYLGVIASGIISDSIVKRTNSIAWARVPLGVCGMIGSSTFFTIGLHLENPLAMVALFCCGSAMVGLCQVVTWSCVQDISTGESGFIPAWTGFWGHVSLGLVPILAAYLVHWTGEWNDVGYIALALGCCGAIAIPFVKSHRSLA